MTITQRNRETWRIDNVLVSESDPFATTWYVDADNGNDSNTGQDPKSAFATLAQVDSVHAAGDQIVLAPGTYPVDVSVASITPLANTTWRAARVNRGGAPTVIIVADADDDVDVPVSIDVDHTRWLGIEFKLVAGGTTALHILDIAQGSAVRGTVFEDCWFNLNDVDAVVIALKADDATNDWVGGVINRCRFLGGFSTSTPLMLSIGVGGATGLLCEDSIFEMSAAAGDCRAVIFGDPGGAGGSYGCTFRNNDFIGPKDGGGDAVGFTLNGTMTEDEIVGIIRTNYFSNCTAAITIDKINNSIVRNYEGDDALGGSIVNPGT